MSEPTVPTPSASAGWPPRVPTNSEPANYPSADPASAYPAPAPAYHQFYVEKPAEIIEGEKLAKTSTIFGIISLFFVGLVLGPMAIIKAAKAEKLGVDSTVGKVTGWLGTIIAAVTVVFTILYIFILGAIFTGAAMNSEDIKTGGFANSQTRDGRSSDQVLRDAAENGMQIEGSNSYRDMTQTEKDKLTQVAKDAAEQIK